jgi:hypothetical protein
MGISDPIHLKVKLIWDLSERRNVGPDAQCESERLLDVHLISNKSSSRPLDMFLRPDVHSAQCAVRSARVSASWMSISSNKSSHEARRRLLPAKGAATSGVDFSTRESAVHAMQAGAKEWAASGQCVRCNSSIHWQASASQE